MSGRQLSLLRVLHKYICSRSFSDRNLNYPSRSKIFSRKSGTWNRESGIGNRESGIEVNRKSSSLPKQTDTVHPARVNHRYRSLVCNLSQFLRSCILVPFISSTSEASCHLILQWICFPTHRLVRPQKFEDVSLNLIENHLLLIFFNKIDMTVSSNFGPRS